LEKAKGRAGPGRGKAGVSAGPAFTDAPTLKELGIDKKTAVIAQQLADLPASTREAIAQRETTIAKEKRMMKAATAKKAAALPDAKYRVIYADPPWSYNDKADEGAIQSGDDVSFEPNAPYADHIEGPWTAVAPHLRKAAEPRYLQQIGRSWDHLAVSAVLRDRHFVSAWTL
jgi:hypothetical protein